MELLDICCHRGGRLISGYDRMNEQGKFFDEPKKKNPYTLTSRTRRIGKAGVKACKEAIERAKNAR